MGDNKRVGEGETIEDFDSRLRAVLYARADYCEQHPEETARELAQIRYNAVMYLKRLGEGQARTRRSYRKRGVFCL